jgi:ribonuclease P protein component
LLTKANRVVRADDFRTTVRGGRRVGTPNALIYVVPRSVDEASRFGFIVSKSVGNSVVRNRVTRRLRAIGREAVDLQPSGRDVVIRALSGASEASWSTLHSEILGGLERSASKQ